MTSASPLTPTAYEDSSIKQLRIRAATDPSCLIGYRLRYDDGGCPREGVCVSILKRRGKSTQHILQNADGYEAPVCLERKGGSAGNNSNTGKMVYGILGKEPARPLQHGYLTKQAVRSKRNWKRRFFVLNGLDRKLRWWETQGSFLSGAAEKGAFDLTPHARTECTLLEERAWPADHANCLRLTCPLAGTVLSLSADSMMEADAWRLAFQCTLDGSTHNVFTAALGNASNTYALQIYFLLPKQCLATLKLHTDLTAADSQISPSAPLLLFRLQQPATEGHAVHCVRPRFCHIFGCCGVRKLHGTGHAAGAGAPAGWHGGSSDESGRRGVRVARVRRLRRGCRGAPHRRDVGRCRTRRDRGASTRARAG